MWRFGYLSHDTLSERKNATYNRDIFTLDLVKRFASSMGGFETAFVDLQNPCGLMIIIDAGSIKGFTIDWLTTIGINHTVKPTFAFSF